MRRWLLFLLLLAGVGCKTAVSPPQLATPTAHPQPTPTLAPTLTPQLDAWQPVTDGIERREMRVLDENGRLIERPTIIRIDPAQHRFEIAYDPQAPKITETWREQLGALLVVNGGFFTPEYTATGLIVIDGVASGQSYGAEAGMVLINDGQLMIQDLAERPYSPNDPIQFGLQSFPMLVKAGGRVGYTIPGEVNRRTVIGVDENGRVLLILTPLGGFSLAAMSQWLVSSDLNLNLALNLDGGTSTSLAMDGSEGVLGFALLPSVIAVYER